MSKRRPPVGTVWRIKAGGLQRGKTVEPRVDIYSRDYEAARDPAPPKIPPLKERTTFDELVIEGLIHVEAMDDNTYYVGFGNGDKVMVTLRNGVCTRGEIYR